MISVIHTEHATISTISNLWFAHYPDEWRRMLAVANALDVPLLALIYQRLRELRDAAARDAFTRQADFGVVTWEWRQQIVQERAVKQEALLMPLMSPKSLESLGTKTDPRPLPESGRRAEP